MVARIIDMVIGGVIAFSGILLLFATLTVPILGLVSIVANLFI